jgi:hypothetical protein
MAHTTSSMIALVLSCSYWLLLYSTLILCFSAAHHARGAMHGESRISAASPAWMGASSCTASILVSYPAQEELIDKLRLLNYEKDFCRRK